MIKPGINIIALIKFGKKSGHHILVHVAIGCVSPGDSFMILDNKLETE